jgi:hypothetical protein
VKLIFALAILAGAMLGYFFLVHVIERMLGLMVVIIGA